MGIGLFWPPKRTRAPKGPSEKHGKGKRDPIGNSCRLQHVTCSEHCYSSSQVEVGGKTHTSEHVTRSNMCKLPIGSCLRFVRKSGPPNRFRLVFGAVWTPVLEVFLVPSRSFWRSFFRSFLVHVLVGFWRHFGPHFDDFWAP